MRIIVRKNHIEEAIKNDSHHCMIHDAIKEYLGVQFISVDTQSIRFSDPATKERYVYLTPPTAQQMILKWDRGIAVQPFSFELSSPVRVTPIRKEYKGKKSTRRKAQRKYDAKRRDPMAPRLVKKNQPPPKPHITRHRKFGIRQFTKE
jgi:hypothetical protein